LTTAVARHSVRTVPSQSALKLNFACSQKHPIFGCCARLRQPARFYAARSEIFPNSDREPTGLPLHGDSDSAAACICCLGRPRPRDAARPAPAAAAIPRQMIASAAAEPEPEERVGQHDDEPSLNLLFYFYCEVADPSALAADQRALCLRLGLRGRVRVASEGINATLSGTTAACDEYARILR
jgi:hypothetical protein